MSEENVEVVRRLFEMGSRREEGASSLALYDEAIVWDVSRLRGVDFEEGIFHGHDGLRRWFREWFAGWESVENHLEELIDVGEHVVSVHTQRGRGRASGIEIELRQYAVWTIRAGKVIRSDWFLTRGEAVEAAGLADPG